MLIRLDDFPTGVRERYREDLVDFGKVLNELESRDMEYVLGVVPGLLTARDLDFLRTLNSCEIALHGYSHNYDKWKGHNFPEFTGMSQAAIENWIYEGLHILQEFSIDKYIPPFNQITTETVAALVNMGMESITSGINGYPGKDLNYLELLKPKREFYGRSTNIVSNIGKFNPNEDHLSLHLTWEVDEMKEHGENWVLPGMLDAIQEKLSENNTLYR